MAYGKFAPNNPETVADPFKAARLVEETRLHYSQIADGRFSEQFYYCMAKIIQHDIYRGYYTLKGKHIKLKGMLDFLYNKHYGLGISSLDHFMLAITDQAVYDESPSRYARQLIIWLKRCSHHFRFPRKAYEMERLFRWIRYRASQNKITEKEKRIFILLFNHCSEILPEIGEDRTYKTFEAAAVEMGLITQRKKKSITFYKDMTEEEIEKLSGAMCRFLPGEIRIAFAEKMLSYESPTETPGEDYAEPDDMAEEQGESSGDYSN